MPTREWEKENKVFIGLHLLKKRDADILKWLEGKESKQGAIKTAIRSYIADSKEETPDISSDKVNSK